MSQRTIRIVMLALLALVVGARAQAGEGDADRQKARSLYGSGMRHYNLAEYGDALKDFKEAYRVHPDAALLFNIGQCYRQLGDATQAATFYRSFRREMPESADRSDIDRLIKEMDRAAEEKRANQPPTGTQAPAEGDVTTPAPPPTTTPAPAAAAPPAVAAMEEPPHRPVYKKGWFWGVTVGAVLVAGGAVTLGVIYGTRSSSSSFSTTLPPYQLGLRY